MKTLRVTGKGKILYALSHSPVCPKFKISCTVKNPESTKDELLANAVSDAKKKAEVLSKAAGVPLKEIQSIDYSWGEIQFETRPAKMKLSIWTLSRTTSTRRTR